MSEPGWGPDDVIVYRARWVVPVEQPPLRDGWVAANRGRIVATGSGAVDLTVPVGGTIGTSGTAFEPQRSSIQPGTRTREIDLGSVALLPGLVNAHTHLELSWLRGRVPPAPSMPEWVRRLLQARASGSGDEAATAAAIDEAVAFGTVAVGDVANSLVSVPALEARSLPAVVFHEVLGFDQEDAAGRLAAADRRVSALTPPDFVRMRIAPHAPYSTSPQLIRAVARHSARSPWPPATIHLAESPEEVRFLDRGDGPWRDLLNDLGIRYDGWQAPGMSPARYLDSLGLWQPGTMAIHCVQAIDDDLRLLASRDVTVVTCPRSNEWVGAGPPPLDRFLSSGVRVAVGTDSLASAPDLNVFEELKRLRELAPRIAARTFLSWATRNGARALGLEADFGGLTRGRRARLLAVRVAPDVPDVEEALLAGVSADEISWVDQPEMVMAPSSGSLQ